METKEKLLTDMATLRKETMLKFQLHSWVVEATDDKTRADMMEVELSFAKASDMRCPLRVPSNRYSYFKLAKHTCMNCELQDILCFSLPLKTACLLTEVVQPANVANDDSTAKTYPVPRLQVDKLETIRVASLYQFN